MTQFYDLLTNIKDSIKSNGITNTVTFGDIFEVDLNKTTIFSLAHIVMGNVAFSDHTITATIQVLFLDIVDYVKEKQDEDNFHGNDNLQDVLNTQMQAVNKLQSDLRRGDLFSDRLQLVTDITAEPFLERFENELAGWGVTIDVQLPNDSVSVC